MFDASSMHTHIMLRLDSTLSDFSGMRWTRGDLSFIFNGEDRQQTQSLSMLLLDNVKKEFQRMKMVGSVSQRKVYPLPSPPLPPQQGTIIERLLSNRKTSIKMSRSMSIH